MQLTELIEQVRDGLTKSQLEELYDSFLKLFASLELRISELEQAEALYMEQRKDDTVASNKRSWGATELGQELIVLKRQSKVCEKYLSSVKHKIFAQY